MSGIKNNRRTQYTKAQLKQALLDLLKEQPLSKISITAICQRADVNRGTFYLHYQSPIDLFRNVEDDMLNQVKPLINYAEPQSQKQSTAAILKIIKQNAVATQIILQDIDHSRLLKLLVDPIKIQGRQTIQKRFNERNPYISDLYFDFIVAGSIKVVSEWLKDSHGISAEEIAKIIENNVPY